MAASPPEPKFSSSDKNLLILMGRLLLEYQEASNSNLPVGKVTLTDSEAAELMERLEELASSRQFLEAAYFVEGIRPRMHTRKREFGRYIFQDGKSVVGPALCHQQSGSISRHGWE